VARCVVALATKHEPGALAGRALRVEDIEVTDSSPRPS
jgi:hypothetical protein